MRLSLLCNAGLALEAANATLLVDAPNEEFAPFYRLPDETWRKIIEKEEPFHKICGFWFTHDHPDHFDRMRMEDYISQWPKTPVFLPNETTTSGRVHVGPFYISYRRVDHAPLPEVPPHVVSWIETGEGSVYLAADAALDLTQHRSFLGDKKADIGIWNSMYLSKPETRALLHDAAHKNYIYHMPANRPDSWGLWKKL